MIKTVLTFAIATLVVATSSFAANSIESTPGVEIANPTGIEINSFCKAIVTGDIETVKRLIDLGADVNQRSLGKTPAIFAARHNRAEILELLIANGADLEERCFKGWTIEKHAALSDAQEVLVVLKKHS